MKNDLLGTRMKKYESSETSRSFLPYIPVYARIDGRSFSKFTRDADRPFDPSITRAMHAATKALVEQTKANIAYVQSDEISLVWETVAQDEEMFFAGKVQKITSVVAGIATAAFIRELIKDADWNNAHPNWIDRLPHFDARVLQVPNRTEAANMFLWREADARKNAITMVASSIYSHKELQGKSGKDKLAMIAEKGMVFDHFPASLRQGAFMRRVVRDVAIPEEQRLSIPERHRPEAGTMVPRSNIEVIDMPQFNLVFNRNEVIFDGAEPLLV